MRRALRRERGVLRRALLRRSMRKPSMRPSCRRRPAKAAPALPSAAALIKADLARSRRLLTGPDRRQDREQLSKVYRRVSGRKRNQTERQPRPANLGAPDRDIQRPGAGRVRDSAGGREGPFQQDHSGGGGKKSGAE